MSVFLLNQLARERADQAAAVGVLVEVCSADEAAADQEPTGGAGEADDIYRVRGRWRRWEALPLRQISRLVAWSSPMRRSRDWRKEGCLKALRLF